jgi:hypothetical protein
VYDEVRGGELAAFNPVSTETHDEHLMGAKSIPQ